MSELGWLIEAVKNDNTVYAPAHYFGEGENLITSDHMKAVRFARKDDAELAIRLLGYNLYKGTFDKFAAIEHQWDTGPRDTDN